MGVQDASAGDSAEPYHLGLPAAFTTERLNALLWRYQHTDFMTQDAWFDAPLAATGETAHKRRLLEVFAIVLRRPMYSWTTIPADHKKRRFPPSRE